MRHMRAIVERQLAPSVRRVRRVQAKPRIRLQGVLQGIQTVIMPGRAVSDVPWKSRVVQLVRVDPAVVDWGFSLVNMRVPR